MKSVRYDEAGARNRSHASLETNLSCGKTKGRELQGHLLKSSTCHNQHRDLMPRIDELQNLSV